MAQLTDVRRALLLVLINRTAAFDTATEITWLRYTRGGAYVGDVIHGRTYVVRVKKEVS